MYTLEGVIWRAKIWEKRGIWRAKSIHWGGGAFEVVKVYIGGELWAPDTISV